MSTKTAEEWIQEGDALDDDGRQDEAIKCFDQAITLDPNIAKAYFLKGYVLEGKGLQDQALICLDRALAIQPDYDKALNIKANILSSQGKHKEAIDLWDRAIAANPHYAVAIHNKGNSQRALGNSNDALISYDKALQINPDYANCYYSKAYTLNHMSRYADAAKCLEKVLQLTPNDTRGLNLMGNCFLKLGKAKESIEHYTCAITLKSEAPLYYCNRGIAYNKLYQKKEALQDFLKAKDLLHHGKIGENISPDNLTFMKETLVAITELQKIADENDTVLQKLNQEDPVVKKFAETLKDLRVQKNKVAEEAFHKSDNQDPVGTPDQAEVERFRVECQKRLQALQTELTDLKLNLATLQKDVERAKGAKQRKNSKQVKDIIGEIKQEFNNKLSDSNRKFDSELHKQNLSPENVTKVKEYFSAFLETFSSAYAADQIADNGHISFIIDSTNATIFSTIASFEPFIDSSLSSGVKTLEEVLQNKEFKESNDKMKSLATDTTALSEIIGKVALDISLNTDKQQEVIQARLEDLKRLSGSIVRKLEKLCDNLDDYVDPFLYVKLYHTPSAMIGHHDANKIIQKWIGHNMEHTDIPSQFVKIVMEAKKEMPTTRTACCNMF